MVTPSLVMVGEPYFLPRTTLRPLGPSVTLTESASLLTPRSRARRASMSNARVLAAMSSFRVLHCRRRGLAGGIYVVRPGRRRRPGRTRESSSWLLLQNGEDVARVEDEVLLAAVLDLGAAVLAVENGVADLDVERDALLAVLVPPTGTDREDGALLRLLLGGVRNDDAGRGGGLTFALLNEDPVLEWLDSNLGGGGHDLPSLLHE